MVTDPEAVGHVGILHVDDTVTPPPAPVVPAAPVDPLLPALPPAPALPLVELPPVPVPVDSVGAQPRASRPRDQITTFVAFMASPVVRPWRNGSRRALETVFSSARYCARSSR